MHVVLLKLHHSFITPHSQNHCWTFQFRSSIMNWLLVPSTGGGGSDLISKWHTDILPLPCRKVASHITHEEIAPIEFFYGCLTFVQNTI